MPDVMVFNTRDGNEWHVRNVPATTIKEACEKVAAKNGWLFIEDLEGQCFGLDQKHAAKWNMEPVAVIEMVKSGELDELRGLYRLLESEIDEEEFGG